MTRFLAFCLISALALSVHRPATAAPPAALQIEYAGHVGGSSLAVAVQGDYAFVGQSAEFAVVDMGDPARPRRVAYLPVAANDIALSDGYAYATNADGLAVIDVQRPDQPVQVGFQPAARPFGSLAVAGDYAYVAAPRAGLFVYDISDPTQPQQVSSLHQLQVEGVAAQGDYVYLATGAGLQIVTLADSGRLALVASAHTPVPVESVTVAGRYAYMTVTPGTLLIADVADPAAPLLLGAVSVPTFAKNVHVVGDLVYVANGNNGVAVVDVSDPSSPRLLGANKIGALVTDVTVIGDHLLATDVFAGGLHVLDARNPGQLVETGVYRAPGVTHEVTAEEHYAYLAGGMNGDIIIVDYADPLNPRAVGFYPMLEAASAIGVSGDRLYAYGGRHAIQVLDITDRMRPVAAGSRQLDSSARVVAVDDHLSFVRDGGGLLHIYDASLPGLPQEVGLFAAASEIRDVAVTDKFLLAAAGAHGVLVAHGSGQMQLARAEAVALPGNAEHVVGMGDYGYVVTSAGDLFTLDLTVPGAARIAGKFALGVQAHAVTLRAGRIYIAAGETGVYILDVANDGESGASRAVPMRVMVYDTPGTALNVEVVDNLLLVADGYAGLLLLRIGAQPVLDP